MSLIFSFQFHFVRKSCCADTWYLLWNRGKKPFDLLTKRRLTSKSFAVKLFEMLQAKQTDIQHVKHSQYPSLKSTWNLAMCIQEGIWFLQNMKWSVALQRLWLQMVSFTTRSIHTIVGLRKNFSGLGYIVSGHT